jgi:hypothetical protein
VRWRIARELEEPAVQEEEAADPDDAVAQQLGDEYGCATEELLPVIGHRVFD